MISAEEVLVPAAIQIPEGRRAEIEEFAARARSRPEFRCRPYWLTTDSGTDPIGIADAKDLADELAKIYPALTGAAHA
jgi:hypothetical protein